MIGKNAIAGFSFAGLTFPGGELPVRLICQPYFCRWKIACVGLPVTHCQTFKFPVVVLPVTAIYQWSIAAECNCRWYICQRKAIAFQERSKLLLCSYLFKRWTLPKASGIPQGPKDRIHGTIHMKVKSNPRPNLHSRTWEEFGLNLEPLKLDHIYKVLDLRDLFEVSEAEIPSFKNF